MSEIVVTHEELRKAFARWNANHRRSAPDMTAKGSVAMLLELIEDVRAENGDA